jgi:sialate O-acetylesterase
MGSSSFFFFKVRWSGVVSAILLGTGAVHADVRLGTPFQDHAVLQRDQPLPVWGWADPDEHVRVTLGDAAPVMTTTDSDGRWRVMLPARPASTTPVELLVEGKNRVVVGDLLVGEVWLCAGQSNMEWRLRFAATGETDVAGADFPQIRQLKVARNPKTIRQDVAPATWTVCSPATAGDFTAVGFYFARDLWRAIGIPVGLINCSHGNSAVEAWMSAETLASEPEFRVVADRWADVMARHPAAVSRYETLLKRWQAETSTIPAAGRKAAKKPSPPVGPNHHQEPSSLFNGMIAPVLPTALRGFLWYQGEGNARRADEYEKLFGSLIRQWRRDFDAPEAAFFWVQLPGLDAMPPATTRDDWVALREALGRTLSVPATGQAIAIDVGDATDIHPTRKREIGERLARLARNRVYGEAIEDRGPEPIRVVSQSSAMHLDFSHSGGALKLGGEPAEAFEIAGEDGRFAAATCEILDGNRVRLRAASVDHPVFVRHAWKAYPRGWLLNADGLPAAPFSRRAE